MRNHALHRIAIHGDDLAQERHRQHRLSGGFFFHDNLGQHGSGDILPGTRVENLKIAPLTGHRRQMFQRDVAAAFRVIQASIGVFLDNHGCCGLCPARLMAIIGAESG